MPLKVDELIAQINREDEELEQRCRDIGKLGGVSDQMMAMGALLACEKAIHARLGDLIKIQLLKG